MDKRVPHSLVQTLGSLPDFAGLDEQDLLTIAGESMNLVWQAGSPIFKPGDPTEALYLVLMGECSIHDEGSDSLDGEVAHPKAGDSFGEMSLLLNAVHSRTATAVTDCEILVLPKESFEKLLDSNPKLAAHFDERARSRHAPLRKASGV
jgi:CRP/FNR family cyclic AMP-dependent transcriptional regulator